MKVLANVDSRKYICEVDHTELEKYLGLYYGNLKGVKVGDDIDLGRGYDYAQDIKFALKSTKEFIEGNQKVINAILSGLTISAIKEVQDAEN